MRTLVDPRRDASRPAVPSVADVLAVPTAGLHAQLPVSAGGAASLERAALTIVRLESVHRSSPVLRTVSAYWAVTGDPGLGDIDDLVSAQVGLESSAVARMLNVEMTLAHETLERVRPGQVLAGSLITTALGRFHERTGRPLTDRGSNAVAVSVELVNLMNRDDVPVLMQATLAAREACGLTSAAAPALGRLVFQLVLRRRGVTSACMVPLPRVTDFAAFPCGDAGLAHAMDWTTWSERVIDEMHDMSSAVRAVVGLPARWRASIQPRRDSATNRLLDVLVCRPVITADAAALALRASRPAVYEALTRLQEEGVLVELSGRRRNRAWFAHDVLTMLRPAGPRA